MLFAFWNKNMRKKQFCSKWELVKYLNFFIEIRSAKISLYNYLRSRYFPT